MKNLCKKIQIRIKRYIAMLLVIVMLPVQSITTEAVQVIEIYEEEEQTVSNNLPEVIEQEYIMQQDWTLTQDEYVYAMKIEAGTLDLNGYTLTVLGDVIQGGGDVKINGGKLHIYGYYRIQGIDEVTGEMVASKGSLIMTQEKDFVSVSGNFISDSKVDHNRKLTAGTMKLYGDFYVYKTKSNNSFLATEKHTIIMCGEETQTISFEISNLQSSRISNLTFEEKVAEEKVYHLEGVPCVTGRITDHTVKTRIKGWLGIAGNPVFENGLYNGDLRLVHFVHIRQPLTVSGNVMSGQNVRLTLYEDCLIYGDLISEGNIGLNGKHLKVCGDFCMNILRWGNTVTNGILEVQGDFTAKSGFFASKDHKVILSGTEPQTIDMGQGQKFATLELRNTSQEGVYAKQIFLKEGLITNGYRLSYLNDSGEFGWTLEKDMIWDGDLVLLEGDLDLNGHSLCVQGDLIQKSGTIKISGGSLQITGDYRMETEQEGVSVGVLQMQNAQDHVTVSGNFISRTNQNHEGYLTDGTLEVQGDFLVYKEDYAKSFFTSGEHTVLLSGENEQTVSVEGALLTENAFQNLTIENHSDSGVRFHNMIPVKGTIRTNGDCPIDGTIGVGKYTDFQYKDGSHLYNGDVHLLEDYTVDKPLVIDGNFSTNRRLILKDDLSVAGDVTLKSNFVLEEAELRVGNNFRLSSNDGINGMSMKHESDRIYVGGDFVYGIPYAKYEVTDGLIEVKGDVLLDKGARLSGKNRLLLSGDALQTIRAGALQSIATLELDNHSEEGVLSKTVLNVAEMITNGCRFRYENMEGISGFCLENDMTVDGDLTILDGTMDLNGHTLTVTGDLMQIAGVVDVQNGTLSVGGNYYMQYRTKDGNVTGIGSGMLNMVCPDDLVCVDGDMIIKSAVSPKGRFTAGEMRIKGEFRVDYETLLETEGTHCITLCGNTAQKITMVNSRHSIQNLILKNTSEEGIELGSNLNIMGQITDECKKISGKGSVYIKSAAVIKNGYFGGNLRVTETDVLTQDLEIGGLFYTAADFDLNGYSVTTKRLKTLCRCNINHGKLYVSEDFIMEYYSRLYMTNPDDEVLVVGNMIIDSGYNHKDLLTDGTLEIRGDFTQKRTINFVATGNHTTILGQKRTEDGELYVQNISFTHPGNARFHKLVLKKVRQTGYVFSADVFTLADEVIEDVTDETPPLPVNGLCVDNVTPTSISISYNSTWDENGVGGYHIFRDDELIGITGETKYTDKGLIPGTTYCYTVYALDYCQNRSDASAKFYVTTAEDAENPAQVTGLVVERVTGSKVCLKWDPSIDD